MPPIRIFSLTLLAALSIDTAGADVFVVDSLADAAIDNDLNPGDGVCQTGRAGTCSIRAAIQEANALAGADTVRFSVAGTVALALQGPLPAITGPLFFDGKTAPGYNGAASSIGNAPPRIWLDGGLLSGSSSDGLRFTTGVTSGGVDAIGIVGMPDDGILIDGTARQVFVANCWIGVRADGSAGGNDDVGVHVNSDTNQIGSRVDLAGNEVGLGNLISGNGGHGVMLGINADDNYITRNLIGLTANGLAARGNGGWGILASGNENLIGYVHNGVTVLAPSIAANALGGVQLFGGNDSIVQASRIGQNVNGGAIASPGDGVAVTGIGHMIGGVEYVRGNRIANHRHGIRLGSGGFAATDTLVLNNRIGSPTLAQGVSEQGIWAETGSGIQLRDNEILNADAHGIQVFVDGTVVEFNRIGYLTNLLGTENHGAGLHGIQVLADDVRIRGNSIGFCGQLQTTQDSAMAVFGSNNEILENRIGVTAGGGDMGNHGAGIHLGAAAAPSLDNVVRFNEIAFNGEPGGIVVQGTATQLRNRVDFNVIDSDHLAVNLLGAPGRDPIDAGDADEGVNRLMNSPDIVAAVVNLGVSPATLDITYRVDTATTAAAYPLYVDFHLGREGSDSMLQVLGFASYPAVAATLERTITVELPPGVSGGWLVGQVQDLDGNSSEASMAMQFGSPDQLFRDGFENLLFAPATLAEQRVGK